MMYSTNREPANETGDDDQTPYNEKEAGHARQNLTRRSMLRRSLRSRLMLYPPNASSYLDDGNGRESMNGIQSSTYHVG